SKVNGIAMQRLFLEPWELMLRSDHPLAGQRSVALEQLDPSEATLMAESHAEGLESEGNDHGHVQDVSLESLAALVSLRGGYALVPTLAHDRLASMPGIVLAKLKGQVPGREIALYWRDASPWQEHLLMLATLLRRLARQRPGLKLLG
ncbi:MAG: LysR substrate-binding domain-containing protein, partial [Rhodanobacter sp.]